MSTRGTFAVAVTKEDLVFAAAHFLTLPGHRCERLHGHNYRASVVVEGALEAETGYVLDFIALKALMRRLTEEWDHRVLLPTENPKLRLGRTGEAQQFTAQALRLSPRLSRWVGQPAPAAIRVRTEFDATELRMPAGIWTEARLSRRVAARTASESSSGARE